MGEMQRRLFDDLNEFEKRLESKRPGWILERALTETDADKPASTKAIAQLPIWESDRRGAPAELMRSALFGVVKRGSRKAVELQLLASWKRTEIRYTGFQLDQADLDCWLQALDIAKMYPLGIEVYFTARSFLAEMGRNNTGNAHRWLRRSIGRMQACGVSITWQGVEYQGPLIEKFYRHEESGRYVIRLNPDLAALFDDNYVKLNLKHRHLLRASLAKYLQGYIQSHRATAYNPHRIGIERLRELSGSDDKSRTSFRQKLKAALEEHIATGMLRSFEFKSKGRVVEWVRGT